MENQKVSIVIPVYNAEKYITETVDSVLQQSYEDWELLLVEDGSADDTVKVISEFTDERIRIILLPSNQGAARARNTGIKEATGRYIAFLDADDLWLPEKLEHQLQFQKELQAGFTFSGYEFGDETAHPTGKVVRVPKELTYRQALRNTTIFTSTVIFDTNIIPKDSIEMPIIKSEDTALWWKILRSGHTAYGLDENLVIYRRPTKSLSSNKLEAVRRIWNLYRKAEHLSVFKSIGCFIGWGIHAVWRRI